MFAPPGVCQACHKAEVAPAYSGDPYDDGFPDIVPVRCLRCLEVDRLPYASEMGVHAYTHVCPSCRDEEESFLGGCGVDVAELRDRLDDVTLETLVDEPRAALVEALRVSDRKVEEALGALSIVGLWAATLGAKVKLARVIVRDTPPGQPIPSSRRPGPGKSLF
jgi:hypothetical protein